MKQLQRAIIFDGDDTLWQTQVLYDEAAEQFYDLLAGLNYDRERVATSLIEKDLANVVTLGFSKHRFPTSMVEVYQSLAQQEHRPTDPMILDRVRDIGYSVFCRRPMLMADAEKTLERLRRSYDLYLYTAGDLEVQLQRLSELSITKHFDSNDIVIVERKTETELQHLMQARMLEPSSTWMIGNSIRSDINPAVKQGLRCLWIHGGVWEYDQEDIVPGRVWQISSLAEIPPLLSAIDKPMAA